MVAPSPLDDAPTIVLPGAPQPGPAPAQISADDGNFADQLEMELKQALQQGLKRAPAKEEFRRDQVDPANQQLLDKILSHPCRESEPTSTGNWL